MKLLSFVGDDVLGSVPTLPRKKHTLPEMQLYDQEPLSTASTLPLVAIPAAKMVTAAAILRNFGRRTKSHLSTVDARGGVTLIEPDHRCLVNMRLVEIGRSVLQVPTHACDAEGGCAPESTTSPDAFEVGSQSTRGPHGNSRQRRPPRCHGRSCHPSLLAIPLGAPGTGGGDLADERWVASGATLAETGSGRARINLQHRDLPQGHECPPAWCGPRSPARDLYEAPIRNTDRSPPRSAWDPSVTNMSGAAACRGLASTAAMWNEIPTAAHVVRHRRRGCRRPNRRRGSHSLRGDDSSSEFHKKQPAPPRWPPAPAVLIHRLTLGVHVRLKTAALSGPDLRMSVFHV